jgi:1,4-dihydroxy-6-naphthoate synthase
MRQEGHSVKRLSLGYSPCPNDTFIFYALVHGRINTDGLFFSEVLEDVETLNQIAGREELDITKVSFHAFGRLREKYCLLRSGAALGRGCGPLVVARENYAMEDLKGRVIAIPGMLTTAYLLLQIYDASFRDHVRVMPFQKIIGAVKDGEVEAGLIIHESRFTYQAAGLKTVVDLGAWWEEVTGLPIPLGGILARRSLGRDLIARVDSLLRKSIEYAFSNRSEPEAYIRKHAQELDVTVMRQHIDLYVNDFSLDLGEEGERAIAELFRRAGQRGILGETASPLFIS